jgi:hypothetical protein
MSEQETKVVIPDEQVKGQETKSSPYFSVLEELNALREVLEDESDKSGDSGKSSSSPVSSSLAFDSDEININSGSLIKEVFGLIKERLDPLLIDNFKATLRSLLNQLLYLCRGGNEGDNMRKLIILLSDLEKEVR